MRFFGLKDCLVQNNALQRVKKIRRFVKCFGFDGFGIAFDCNDESYIFELKDMSFFIIHQ
jgi:hypothetical protein